MAETFLLEIVTPYRKLLSTSVEEMTAPGELGEFGVLAGHSPYLVVLKAGALTYKSASEHGTIAIGRGYAEVLPNKTTILVQNAEQIDEIDADGARKIIADAEEALKTLSPEDQSYAITVENYELAQARLAVKERKGTAAGH